MNVPGDLKYTKEHEWARAAGKEATVGITDHAQSELGDIVFVELPEVGTAVARGKAFGVVESVKAVSDLYSPVTGKVLRVNEALVDSPEKVNEDPYGDGWMIVVEQDRAAEIESLLSADAYAAYVEEEKGK